MLTCKINEKIVNTIEYKDKDLRKWSNKGILKCPICKDKMVYRNGNYKIAHFSHEYACGEEGSLIYSHPETKEHITGKLALYNWLKTQNVENLKLEHWIPETKQRPDIYFELDGVRYVIEYQCSPIATQYDERRSLYELAGIKDIWILGIENYEIIKEHENLYMARRTKTIERDLMSKKEYPLMYLSDDNLYFTSTKKRRKITEVVKYINPYKQFKLELCEVKELLDLDSYENKKYKKDPNKIEFVSRKIFKDVKQENNIENITREGNKIYIMYGNIKKMIHICWDETEVIMGMREFDYIPVIVNSEFYDFNERDPFNKFKEFERYNYLVRKEFRVFNEYQNIILDKFNLESVYTIKSKINRDFKNYKIILFDSFYKNMPKSKSIGSYYKLCGISEKEMSMCLKSKRPNYLSVCKQFSDKKLRILPDDMLNIKRKLESEGYNNIEIYWG